MSFKFLVLLGVQELMHALAFLAHWCSSGRLLHNPEQEICLPILFPKHENASESRNHVGGNDDIDHTLLNVLPGFLSVML